ncbi:MAG: hypothetical protein Q4E64_10185 [Phascolarctobacterium sp.]|uniref:hypothetical protein n=1 Tax=Phascolarctobacterium sp. TaxID=2049039 RepID=UPI0026DD0CA9|nr:hypothetical protein [Phascolarctobacterium sp.]MDO4922175.1 hypothetical protein [Phascolarctobacterium sp.]
MSEKLFSRLYWRPYLMIGVSMLLVMLSSLTLYVLPHEWLATNHNNYGLYAFKAMAWLIKLSMLTYLFGIYLALRKNYFPRLGKLCCKEARAVITGYSKSWTRGKQLCPIFTYTVDGKEYSEALNEAHGSRTKDGDQIDRGFTLKLPRKIKYNPDAPREFYLLGEEYYSRKGAIARFVLFSLLYFLQLYLNVFMY